MAGPLNRFRLKLRAGVAAAMIAAAPALSSGAAYGANALSFGFQKYDVLSPSMAPTLLVHDRVMAFPLAKPARGDLVAYRMPKKPSTAYIKRIVGLPGDRIEMIRGVLNINGQAVVRERIEDFNLLDAGCGTTPVRQWRETLPCGASHRTLDTTENALLDNTPVHTVPQGHYFVMGDNRDNSSDSRLADGHGPVPAENIIGRIELIYFSIDERESAWKLWRWPWSVRWNRMLTRTR